MTARQHNEDEIRRAAERFEQWADQVDLNKVEVESTEDLREVAEAAEAVAAAEARLIEAVAIARAEGWSWNRIAVALGVSRQAARQRFSDSDRGTKVAYYPTTRGSSKAKKVTAKSIGSSKRGVRSATVKKATARKLPERSRT